MAGDTGAPGEDIQSSGPLSTVLLVPLAFVVSIATLALVLKGASRIKEYVPELPLLVDALALVVLGSVLFYAGFRVRDLLK